MTQSQTVTPSHKQELVFLYTGVYRTPSHKYIKMTVTKTNAIISLMQQTMSQWVARYLRCHFEWHINLMAPGHPQMILGACRDRMHEIKCPWMDSQSEDHDLSIQI